MVDQDRNDAAAYSPEKFLNPFPDNIQFHYWMMARARIVARRLRPLLSKDGDLVLDVGCGRGIVVDFLRKEGIHVVGCDLGHPVPIIPAVAPHLHLGIEAGALPDKLRSEVRIVLLLDVLEHLPDPVTFVTGLLNSFPECKCILVTVPARMELWSNFDEFYGHKLRYDLPAIKKLALDTSCSLLNARYFFHALWLPARLMAAVGRKRQVQLSPPRFGTRWLHQLIAGCFTCEERYASKVPGTSIIATLKRGA